MPLINKWPISELIELSSSIVQYISSQESTFLEVNIFRLFHCSLLNIMTYPYEEPANLASRELLLGTIFYSSIGSIHFHFRHCFHRIFPTLKNYTNLRT